MAQYGNYYCGVISGMDCAAKKVDTPISGIDTRRRHAHHASTLDQPTGDFLYRLAMPATKAIPEEVAKCFTKAGDYGVDVISSGPYMILGEDKIDISLLRHDQADRGLRRRQGHDARPQPQLRPLDGQHRVP